MRSHPTLTVFSLRAWTTWLLVFLHPVVLIFVTLQKADFSSDLLLFLKGFMMFLFISGLMNFLYDCLGVPAFFNSTMLDLLITIITIIMLAAGIVLSHGQPTNIC